MTNQFKNLWAYLLIGGMSFSACQNLDQTNATTASVEESQKANMFFERVYEEGVERSPMQQTYLGRKTNNDKWDDLSEASELEEQQIRKAYLSFLKDSIDASLLDEQTQLSYRLMKEKLKRQIEGFKYKDYSYPVNQMFGLHAQVPAFLLSFHKIDTPTDAQAYISRLNAVKPMFKQLEENLNRRAKVGILLPTFLYPKVLDASKNVIKGYPMDDSQTPNLFLKNFEEKVAKLDLTDEEVGKLKNECISALKESVKPAYESLIQLLEEQQKQTNNDAGVWKLKDGDKFYDFALAGTTTTSLTADEIHQIGLNEVDRIHGEMKAIMKQLGFKGTLQEFFVFMKEDQQFYYPNTEEGKQAYLDSATKIVDAFKLRLDELFITKPKADMLVKRVEAFREKTAGKAFYNSPAIDGSRPGFYYANLYDMNNMPKYEMEALAFHEGIPGHHMQLSIAQELEGIPEFRKHGRYTAYIEGWGLYCEFIPKEMGFYKDPYSDFGRLSMEIWRACRLVVDTGIHAKKWTREEGIAYYQKNTPASYLNCEQMVDRHIVMPSQATAYKIGMLKILELREKAKIALEDQFDIRKFHDIVLTSGPVPLNILEEMIDNWINEEQKLEM
ncbi:DUF885 domain-containing protein [Sediminitomix flava]|uniref:Uncharacterized protein (DUF885 family) n=1 Tax=Sediminitomix flava TaxID=379075 RepID=A0A315ZA78_SEDFL|nr:DUF885 domain-containing protein [Sediminitomix flava]PWJ42485.1 uncharacterized protein (DUF885 family) [Sediminitomix flava]